MVLGENSQWNGLLMHVVNFVDQLFSTVYRPDDSVRRGSMNSRSGWLPDCLPTLEQLTSPSPPPVAQLLSLYVT